MAENDEDLTISQTYAKGKEELTRQGSTRVFPPDSTIGASAAANRAYLDAMFFRTRYLSPVRVDTGVSILGVTLETPVFCSPMSSFRQLSDTALVDIANGVKAAGSLLMLGIGGSNELQSAIDTGVPVVKIVKPYQKTELIYEKLAEAKSRGCVAVGMDIDHFYGTLRNEKVSMTDLFGPQRSEILRQLIASTPLPFVVKGVLSVEDAEEAVGLGASAVIVSSHGSSALDFALPPIMALPEIAKAVGDKVTVLVDSGFKTGNDVVKALALGARAVGFARSLLLAWGAGGSTGVENLIRQITAELRRTLAAVGYADPTQLDRSAIVIPAEGRI